MLLSAVFAALTAIFAGVGVEDVNADLATLIRTLVIMPMPALSLFAAERRQALMAVAPRT